MPTQFSVTSVIVLGAWNPAILTPEWLSLYKVIDALPADSELGLDIPSHRLHFSSGPLSWSVDNTRFEIKLKKLHDCGQYAARILGLLPHTPVQGIGTNFIFRCPPSEWPKEYLWKMPGVELDTDAALQVQWAITQQQNETRLQITTTRIQTGDVIIAFNFHRATDSATKAAEFAAKWSNDKDLAESFIRTIFKLHYD